MTLVPHGSLAVLDQLFKGASPPKQNCLDSQRNNMRHVVSTPLNPLVGPPTWWQQCHYDKRKTATIRSQANTMIALNLFYIQAGVMTCHN
jgi:hypothetical protein